MTNPNLFIPTKVKAGQQNDNITIAFREIERWLNSNGVYQITSNDGSITVTNPTGPVVDLHAAGGAATQFMFFTARMLLPAPLTGIWQGQLDGGIPVVTGSPTVEGSQSFSTASIPLARTGGQTVLFYPTLWSFTSTATAYGVDIAVSNTACTEFLTAHGAITGPTLGNAYGSVTSDFTVSNQIGTNLSLGASGIQTAITDVFVAYLHAFQGTP